MGLVQGHWTANREGPAGPGVPDDDEGEVRGIIRYFKDKANRSYRIELQFILLFRYFRKIRAEKLQKLANIAAEKAGKVAPVLVK